MPKPSDVGNCTNCKWATPLKDRIDDETFPIDARSKLEKLIRQFPQHRWECHGSPVSYAALPADTPKGLAPRAQQLPIILQPELRLARDCDWCRFWEKRTGGMGNGESKSAGT
jgi:hypothetical protein